MPFSPSKTGSNAHVVITGREKLVIEHRPVPTIGDGDVLVKVMATGICGTDLSFFRLGAIGSRVITAPLVLGHEGAGIVEAVGSKPGDHIAIEPALPCRVCRFCRAGQWNYCVDDGYFATPGNDGTLCQYYATPATNCVVLPNHLSWPEAGCIQPLAIAVQIARRAGQIAHANLAVFGCGPLGMLTMAVARAYGVGDLIAFDRVARRVEFAKTYAKARGVVVEDHPKGGMEGEGQGGESVEEESRRLLYGWKHTHGLDIVVDTTGAQRCIQLAVELLRPGGTLVLAGMGAPHVSFPTLEVASKELNVVGSLRYTTRCFEDGIHLVEQGLVDLKPLITRTFPLAEAADAFRHVAASDEIKVVIMNQE